MMPSAVEQLEALIGQLPVRPVSSFSPEELELADAILARAGRPGEWNLDVARRILDAAMTELTARGRLHLPPAFLEGAPAAIDLGELIGLAKVAKMAVGLLCAHHAELRSVDDSFFAR